MKNLFLSFALFSFFFGFSQEKNGVETVSLNGNWKFYVIDGQGSNSLNVVEEPSDVIIDNSDVDNLEIKGDWKLKKEGDRGSTVYKNNYLVRNFKANEAADNYVRFFPKVKKSGYYEAFFKMPFVTHLTGQINVNHSAGKEVSYFNLRTRCGEWLSLGIYNFKASEDNYVEFTAITEGSIGADAVLFKPISEEKYLNAKSEPNQVYLKDYDDSKWYNLKVPGHWGMINDFSNYAGKAWYRKTLEIPENWKATTGERIRLKFEGVYHLSKVYVNGQFIGQHQGGFTPFEFDVTDHLKFGSKNVIAVEVDNNFIVGATWNWGGIIRDVELVRTNDIRIQHQYIHATPDLKFGTANLKLKVRIENNSDKNRSLQINSTVFNEAKIASMQKSIEVKANSVEEFNLETNLKAENVKLWHFDDPNLYQLKTTIAENTSEIHSSETTFGIRKIEINKSQLILNGEPVRLGGFNRVSEHRYWGSSEPLELLEKDVDLMKEAGANFMRIMHGTQNEKLIELCDKKGILLFEEINVRDLTNPEFDAPTYTLPRQWLKGMVERDINHPSIIGWSVGNELSDHFDYATDMMDYVRKELDPYRLVTCVSNSGQKPAYTPATDPNTNVDVIMHNMYKWQGEPEEILNTLRSKWPDKPVFISEYGFDPFPSTSLDGDREEVTEWHQHFKGKNEFVIGTSLWTFNDYRSGYAATTAEENRVWGLINVWRQKRKLFDRMVVENSPVNDILVENFNLKSKSANVSILIKGRTDYPSYTLKNYQLVWKFFDSKGKVIQQKSQKLPVIKPEDGKWTGVISWDKVPSNVAEFHIELVNSLNYVRFTKQLVFKVPNAPKVNETILGNTSVRIHFNNVANANEYLVRYKNAEGKIIETPKTISNFVDVENLTANKNYEFTVIAINEKGNSKPSKTVKATPNGKLLPPIIWDAFIRDEKLIIGYSSDFEDALYEVNYGTSKKKLNQTFSTNVKGMMTIDIAASKEIYFKIRRIKNSEKSNWSQLLKAN